jgi:hypothetical protein
MTLQYFISSKFMSGSPVKREGGDVGKYLHFLYVHVTHAIKETHNVPTYGDKNGRNIILIKYSLF